MIVKYVPPSIDPIGGIIYVTVIFLVIGYNEGSLFILPIGYMSILGMLSPASHNMTLSLYGNLQLIRY